MPSKWSSSPSRREELDTCGRDDRGGLAVGQAKHRVDAKRAVTNEAGPRALGDPEPDLRGLAADERGAGLCDPAATASQPHIDPAAHLAARAPNLEPDEA